MTKKSKKFLLLVTLLIIFNKYSLIQANDDDRPPPPTYDEFVDSSKTVLEYRIRGDKTNPIYHSLTRTNPIANLNNAMRHEVIHFFSLAEKGKFKNVAVVGKLQTKDGIIYD